MNKVKVSGSFMPTDSGGTKSRTGGMSVSLAGSDGRILGGGLAGLLVAVGPVQVVIGSFLLGHQQEHKPKKQKFELAAAFSPYLNKELGELAFSFGVCFHVDLCLGDFVLPFAHKLGGIRQMDLTYTQEQIDEVWDKWTAYMSNYM